MKRKIVNHKFRYWLVSIFALIAGVLIFSWMNPSVQPAAVDVFPSEASSLLSVQKSEKKDIEFNPKQDRQENDFAVTDNLSTMEEQIVERLSEMSLEEKVAQLFIVTPEAITGQKSWNSWSEEIEKTFAKYPVSGLIFFHDNLENPDSLLKMTNSMQEYAIKTQGMPMFLSIDEEGGSVARIGNHEKFSVPKFQDVRNSVTNKEEAYQRGKVIGDYLKKYGFNLDFAPTADVLTNPQNTVVQKRSFGSNPEQVSEKSLQMAKGLQDSGILPCFKHFPGHGSTKGDTHEGFAQTDRTLLEMRKAELVPFQRAVQEKIPLIMVAHISVPDVCGNNRPASLSKEWIDGILKQELGYQGLIITDSMQMEAITEHYNSSEAAGEAFQAGADIILMPENFEEAYQAILTDIIDGKISMERVDDSVGKILAVRSTLSGTK